jgi:hypothetical protein
MATVRITRQLRNSIIGNLQVQFGVRREAIKAHIRDGFMPMLAQYKHDLLAVILEQHNMLQDVYDAIPDGWSRRVRTLKARRINDVSMSLMPGVQFDVEIKIPQALNYTSDCLTLEHPRLQPYADYASIANANLELLGREEAEATREATHLLTQCGSLKQALEAWPYLMELLPDWAIVRHNQVAEKRQRKTVVVVDADRLTGAVLAGKMATAALNS